MKNEPFVIERTYNAPVEKVWEAITNRDQMEQWYFKLKEFKPEVGFVFEFEGGPPEKIYLHRCEITEVIPNKKLTHSWQYVGYPGNSFVTWELTAQGDKTTLKLTHAGLETFDQTNGDFAGTNFAMGWTELVGSLLKGFVEKG
ncbi:SRPBCC domain-containing protein [Mucilaginibacter sp. AW1-3]